MHPWVRKYLTATTSRVKRWHRTAGNRAVRRRVHELCGELARVPDGAGDALFPLRAEYVDVWALD
jgi:hypothetical protein